VALRKRWKTDRLHWPGGRRRREHEAEVAARLTPPEETEEFRRSRQGGAGAGVPDDTIRVASSSVRVPDQLTEDEGGGSAFRLDAVVVVILALTLAFIAFVAWQITLMPGK
jgi:hypothetical protein